MPLDIDQARKHGQKQAAVVRATGAQLDILSDRKKLGEFGPGVPLYFDFLGMSILLMSLIGAAFLTVMWQTSWSRNAPAPAWNNTDNLPSMASHGVSSLYRGPLTYNLSDLTTGLSCTTALAATDNEGGLDHIALLLVMVMLGSLSGLAMFFAWYPSRQESIAEEIDADACTINEYTMYLFGFPDDYQVHESDVYGFLDEVSNGLSFGDQSFTVTSNIVQIVLAFDIEDLWSTIHDGAERIEKRERLQEIKRDMALMAEGSIPSVFWCASRESARKEAGKIDAEEKALLEDSKAVDEKLRAELGSLKTVGAYVTFSAKEDLDWTVKSLRSTWCKPAPKFAGKALHGVKADHPTDIYWQHVGKEGQNRGRRMFSWLCCVCLIFLSFVAASYAETESFEVMQINMTRVGLGQYNDLANSRQGTVIQAILLNVVNFILYFIIDILTTFEKRRSFTHQELTFMEKATLATVCNSVGAVFVAHWINDPRVMSSGEVDPFAVGALADEALSVIISSTVLTPLLSLFPIAFLIKTLPKRYFVTARKFTSRQTQREANAIFHGPEFDISDHASSVMNSIFFALVASPLLPVAPAICAGNLLIQYFVDRYVLLRVACRPHYYDKELLLFVSRLLPYLLVPLPIVSFALLRMPNLSEIDPATYALRCIRDVVSWDESGQGFWVRVGAAVTVLLACLPMAQVILKGVYSCLGCRPHYGKATLRSYHEAQSGFSAFYHKENPVYAMLPDSINPEQVPNIASNVVGARGGVAIADYLKDQNHLDQILGKLRARVEEKRQQTRATNQRGKDAAKPLLQSGGAAP